MSKNSTYRARRADRPTVAALHQRQNNLTAMRSIASASANQHADEMETALIAVTELAAESGVAVWGEYDRRDLVAIVADLDPTHRLPGESLTRWARC